MVGRRVKSLMGEREIEMEIGSGGERGGRG